MRNSLVRESREQVLYGYPNIKLSHSPGTVYRVIYPFLDGVAKLVGLHAIVEQEVWTGFTGLSGF